MYEADKSLMVKVNQEDCIICNTPSSVNATKYNDGYSVVNLNQTRPNYSISGLLENNNEKIIIHVMTDLTCTTPTDPSLPTQAPPCECYTFHCIFLGFFQCIVSILVVLACVGEREENRGRLTAQKSEYKTRSMPKF